MLKLIIYNLIFFILGYQAKKHNLRPRSKKQFEIHNVYFMGRKTLDDK